MLKKETDVLIIGSGGAGLRAAIELHKNKVKTLIVGKCQRRDAHTILATGGINAALKNMDKGDSWQLHAADTIKDGGFINDPEAVKILCRNAPNAVKELAKWGAKFHKEKNGKISQRFFGAATYRRACFVGDHTGKEILNVLVDQVLKRKVPFESNVYIFKLLKSSKNVTGALGLDIKTGKIIHFSAKITILATGGHSRMFKRSSSRFWENNGDGINLAYNAGCDFMDMEMFQFHPTGMLHPKEAEGTLVTEAVRGEGGLLFNNKGERFMKYYDKERMELSARDIVAKSIYSEVKKGHGTRHGGVWLDITHKPKSYILKRLPKMYHQFMHFSNLDISKKRMEVGPTAHYSMGGIHIDHKTGKTRIKNLYAIGEVTSGVHGGNRLGGNSLAEICVFGRLTALQIIKDLKKIKKTKDNNKAVLNAELEFQNSLSGTIGKNPIEIKKQLQELMWKYVGVVRNERELKIAYKKLQRFKKIKLHTGIALKMNEKLVASLDVKNMIITCEMIIKSALLRKESRRAHFRSDYPKTVDKWHKNIICKNTGKGFKLVTKKVPPTSNDIRKFFNYKRKDHMLE